MANPHRYVSSVERRFYGPHWLALCDLIRVEPQKYGAFAKNGHMIGLKLPIDFDVEGQTKSLKLIYDVKDNGVRMSCYLMGTRYYQFVYFEQTIAVSEDTYENVRQRTVESQ